MGRYEKEVQALQKEAKVYLDSMRGECGRCVESGRALICVFWLFLAMVAAQGKIADTIDVFYGAADRTSEGAMAANAYKRSVDELDASTTREFVSSKPSFYVVCCNADGGHLQDAPYRTCILEPLGKMNAYFPTINETISKRNKKVRSIACRNEECSLIALTATDARL